MDIVHGGGAMGLCVVRAALQRRLLRQYSRDSPVAMIVLILGLSLSLRHSLDQYLPVKNTVKHTAMTHPVRTR